MRTTFRVLYGLLAAVAIVILLASPNTQAAADSGDRTFPALMGVLVVISAMLLHWLLDRHVTAVDLYPPADRARLLAAAEKGYQQGFFRGAIGIGYILVINYGLDIAGFGFHAPFTTSSSYLAVGVMFIFLGIAARARAIIVSLLQGGDEPAQPSA